MTGSNLDQLAGADLPHRFGRYELRSILGEGGMARVFQAELLGPAGFRKPVALKVIKAEAAQRASSTQVRYFIREARLGGLLKHPNIVDVYELGGVEGQLFIAMELVVGVTMHQLIRSAAPVPAAVVLEIAAAAAAGLGSAHALSSEGMPAGLVHRDLKPSNVLLSWDGEVKIADFGIAITRRGELSGGRQEFADAAGTLSYMSPEQLLGKPLDGRSDLFSLAVLLTELATAKLLPRQYIHKRLLAEGELLAPLLPPQVLGEVDASVPGLSRILLRCLEPAAEDRYASAEVMLSELESLRAAVGAHPRLRSWLPTNWATEYAAAAGSNWAATLAFGVTQDGGSASAEPSTDIASGPRPRTNIGPPLDSFVGRESQLTELSRLFEQGARLVTVKGTGGAGKTRFANRFARSQWAKLGGGSWLVDLTEARSAMAVLQAAAMALDVPLRGDDSPALATQLGYAIAARGEVLLVLDNFEQLLEWAPETVGLWQQLAAEACFLVTSREPLKLAGEEVFVLDPLPPVEGQALFKLRARSAGARWPEDSDTRAVTARIVEELDGLPLAIELAAVRARVLSPTDLLERLSSRFQLLAGGRRGDTGRQSTLRGMIRWSWELLEPWEQSALSQLSVFRDGFFMEAAEEVLDLSPWPDAPWSLDVVGSLMDKSLLRSWEVLGQPRFGMYVSIREYAAEQLAAVSGSASDALQLSAQRHASHYARFGSRDAIDSLYTHGGVLRRRRLALELENLLAGVEVALARDKVELAVACAMAAAEVYQHHGPFADGVSLLLRLEDQPLGAVMSGDLCRRTGFLLSMVGRTAEAEAKQQQALGLYRSVGDRSGEGAALTRLADLAGHRGQIEEALQGYRQALAIQREIQDRYSEAISTGNLGMTLKDLGHTAEAVQHLSASLAMHREVGNPGGEAIALGSLAHLRRDQGRVDEAMTAFRQVLAIAREGGDRRFEGITLGNMAIAHQDQGRIPEALEHYQRSLAISREVGDRRLEAITLGNLGDLLFAHEDLAGGESHLQQAITLAEEVMPFAAGAFRGSLGLLRAQQGCYDEARALIAAGEPCLRGVHKLELGKLLAKKSLVEQLAGGVDAARSALAEAESIATALGVPPESELGQAVAEARARLAD